MYGGHASLAPYAPSICICALHVHMRPPFAYAPSICICALHVHMRPPFAQHLCLVPPYAFASILDGELILLTNLLTNLDGELILLTLNASTLNASTLSATTLSATTLNASTTHAYIANASTANTTATAATTTAAASFLQLTATASLGGLRAMSQYLSMLLLVSHPLVSTPSLSSASVVTQVRQAP